MKGEYIKPSELLRLLKETGKSYWDLIGRPLYDEGKDSESVIEDDPLKKADLMAAIDYALSLSLDKPEYNEGKDKVTYVAQDSGLSYGSYYDFPTGDVMLDAQKLPKFEGGKDPKNVLNPHIQEWGDLWRERLQPSASSKVLLKWNSTGKKPKPETSQERTNRRIKEETKRTWRSNAADIAHGIGEAALSFHPYTAIPYFGAKVGQDVINGNVGLQTAVNASIPLFHLSPSAVGLREATDVALEDAANAGSKTARNWRVAREINNGIKLNTKNGIIEVGPEYFNSENNWYRISSVPEKIGLLQEGKNITTRDANYIPGSANRWRSDMLEVGANLNFLAGEGVHLEPGTGINEGYFVLKPGFRISKTGSAHGNTSLASKGILWLGSTARSPLFPEGVIEGLAPLVIPYGGASRSHFINTPWEEVPIGGRVGFHTGEMPMSDLGWFLKTKKGTYTYEPIIPEKRIMYEPIAEDMGYGTYRTQKALGWTNYNTGKDPNNKTAKTRQFDDAEAARYIGWVENADSVGFDKKRRIWTPPKSAAYDRNSIGMGLDMRKENNPYVYNYLRDNGRLKNPYLTEKEERMLREKTWKQKKDTYMTPFIQKYGPYLNQTGYNRAAGMLWQGHPYKMMNNEDSVTGKAFQRSIKRGDKSLQHTFDTYYGYKDNATRYENRRSRDKSFK